MECRYHDRGPLHAGEEKSVRSTTPRSTACRASANTYTVEHALDAGTHGILNARAFGAYPRSAIVVNAARGDLVDDGGM